jgi:hypothetical protein
LIHCESEDVSESIKTILEGEGIKILLGAESGHPAHLRKYRVLGVIHDTRGAVPLPMAGYYSGIAAKVKQYG